MAKNSKEAGGPDYSGWRILTSPGVWASVGLLAAVGGITDSVSTSSTKVTQEVDKVIPIGSQIEGEAAETVIADFDDKSHEQIRLGEDTIVIPRIADSDKLRQALITKNNYRRRQKLIQETPYKIIEGDNTAYRGVGFFSAGIILFFAGIAKQIIDNRRFNYGRSKASS